MPSKQMIIDMVAELAEWVVVHLKMSRVKKKPAKAPKVFFSSKLMYPPFSLYKSNTCSLYNRLKNQISQNREAKKITHILLVQIHKLNNPIEK